MNTCVSQVLRDHQAAGHGQELPGDVQAEPAREPQSFGDDGVAGGSAGPAWKLDKLRDGHGHRCCTAELPAVGDEGPKLQDPAALGQDQHCQLPHQLQQRSFWRKYHQGAQKLV